MKGKHKTIHKQNSRSRAKQTNKKKTVALSKFMQMFPVLFAPLNLHLFRDMSH